MQGSGINVGKSVGDKRMGVDGQGWLHSYGWELFKKEMGLLTEHFLSPFLLFYKIVQQLERHLVFQIPGIPLSTPHGHYPPPLCPPRVAFQKVIPDKTDPSNPSLCPLPWLTLQGAQPAQGLPDKGLFGKGGAA